MKNTNNLLNPTFPSVKEFYDLVRKSLEGLQKYNLIMAAWESGLFEFTITPKTYTEIAQHLDFNTKITQLFCEALTEIGLLIKKEEKYVNSPLTRNYLSRNSPQSMKYTLENMKNDAERWTQLSKILKNGPIPQKREDFFNDEWILRIAEGAESGSVYNVLKTVTSRLKVNKWKRLLDIGGGHGLYAIGFSAVNPELEAYVFDLPKVTSITCKFIKKYDAQRVHVISGDFNKDDIGEAYDVIFSSFNQSCSDPKFITKLVDALNPDGYLLLRRFKDRARKGAMKRLDWNLTNFEGKKIGSKPFSGGKIVDKEEYLNHLETAGVSVLDIISVDERSEIVFAQKSSTGRRSK